jgi:hypothetical protein
MRPRSDSSSYKRADVYTRGTTNDNCDLRHLDLVSSLQNYQYATVGPSHGRSKCRHGEPPVCPSRDTCCGACAVWRRPAGQYYKPLIQHVSNGTLCKRLHPHEKRSNFNVMSIQEGIEDDG